MTPVNAELDETLRRALHAEADLVEPAGGGLDRIRQRTHAPWLARQASLMLTECVDLAWLIVIRLEPGLTRARAAIADRGGVWQALVGVLSSTVSILAGLVMPSRRARAAHRAGPGEPPRSRARAGSSLSWLRPALAVGAAVVIVVAGVFGLAQVRDNLVLELFPSSNSPASTGTGSPGGQQGPTLNGQSPGGLISPASPGTGTATPSPTATCSPTPKQQATPTPSVSVTPSQTPTPTSTPTPTPTDTVTPTPTSTGAAQTAAGTATTVSIQTVAKVAPASTPCASAKPHSTPAS